MGFDIFGPADHPQKYHLDQVLPIMDYLLIERQVTLKI